MAGPKFSIVVPYKQRLDNIKIMLTSLADQTTDSSNFEIIVGVMEYSTEYVSACREFAGRLDIVSVLTDGEWNVCRARNIALRHVSGEVVLLLDADMAVPPRLLDDLYDRYFRHGQNICVVGQMADYDDVWRKQVDTVEILPYQHYRDVLTDMELMGEVVRDPRWTPEYATAIARFPWAFARTGVLALPAATVREHDLVFDEEFCGWGVENEEWALRMMATGTPIHYARDVYALHLPHARDLTTNTVSARANTRYYLAKWPRLDMEVATAFGWLEAASCLAEIERELTTAGDGRELGMVRGSVGGRDFLLLGVVLDGQTPVADPELDALLDGRSRTVLPLVGFATPYSDESVDECRILPSIMRLSPRYRDAILREADRVARKVVAPAGHERR